MNTANPSHRRGVVGRRECLALLGSGSAAFLLYAAMRHQGAGANAAGRSVAPAIEAERAIPSDVDPLDVALNLAWLGAEFHSRAATGEGPRWDRLTGMEAAGPVRGGRRVMFRDPMLVRYAREIARDRADHVVALRRAAGNRATPQPAIDLTTGPRSAFGAIGQAAGLAPEWVPFDPFSGDGAFLLGAFLVGDEVAAVTRVLLSRIEDPGARTTLDTVLADTIYHAGLIRSLIAAGDPAIGRALASLCAMQALPNSDDLIDAQGDPIAFLRRADQLRWIRVGDRSGFLPGR